MLFSKLKLSSKLVNNLKELGYLEATPIQQRVIPLLMEGRDIIASSQTGTGKSASFIIPILESLKERDRVRVGDNRYKIDALILAPTRELVVQIHKSIESYSKGFKHKSVALYGGVKLGGQIREIRSGANIAVATTARAIEHIKNGTLNLSEVKIVILDEADRLLDMGFIDDIKKIIKQLPSDRQSAMFSATFSKTLLKLGKSLLDNPISISIESNISVKKIKESLYHISKDKKYNLLVDILKSNRDRQVLIFVNRKREAESLFKFLELNGIKSLTIHGDKAQSMREEALSSFKDGRVNILIATDVVSRGIDIKELPLVINFELPIRDEDYIHRIGRTGRAKRSGEAISFVSKDEIARLKEIERTFNISMEIKSYKYLSIKKTIDSKKSRDRLKEAKELALKIASRDKKSIKNSHNRKYSRHF